jgi:hypothetical protein
MPVYSVEEAHHLILIDAEDLANHKIQTLGWGVAGKLFRFDPVRSKRGGLTLSMDRVMSEALSDEQIQEARAIGLEAIKKALAKNKEPFVGLIVGDARQGRNYFDRYKTKEEAQ